MASPTSDEILEIFEELNYPSANKLRAALIKRGFKARLKDVEAFVKSQTPTQLFAKAPKYQGKIVATRPNERWVIDFIDFTAEPSQNFKYIFLIQDIYSRKLWAKATEEKGSDDYIEVLESLFADTGKPTEINADGEFDNRTFNRFLSRRGISVRYKQGRNDLATLDAAMNNFKKMLKKQMQEKNTKEWEPLVQKVVKAHNNLSHEALMAGADPNDAYDESNKALQFELREEAGRKIAHQNAVVERNQKNVQDNGAFRTYIGREDIRRRGDRPQYSGEVKLVSVVEGNRVKDASGNVHSLTLAKPVPRETDSTTINVRLAGSEQTENRKRDLMMKHAKALKTILRGSGWMYMSSAATELAADSPSYKSDRGKMTFKQFVVLFPEMFETQTSAGGGTSKVRLR